MSGAIDHFLSSGSVGFGNVRAVVVSVDSTTVVTRPDAEAASTPTHVWSVTKSVLSTLVGIAIDDGIIEGLDATLGDLLPAYRADMSAAVAAVTVRQLLTMTAGCPPDSTLWQVMNADRDAVRAILSACRPAKQGEEVFEYSSTDTHLLAAVLAAALDRRTPSRHASLLDYAREKLFDPLDIGTRPAYQGVATTPKASAAIEDADPHSAFERAGFAWATDRQGVHSGCCLLKLTAQDMTKIGELYLNLGTWHGRRIVSAAWIEQATKEAAPGYGFLWWMRVLNGHHAYAAMGSRGQLIVVVPDVRLVVALTSRSDSIYDLDTTNLFPLVSDVIMPMLV